MDDAKLIPREVETEGKTFVATDKDDGVDTSCNSKVEITLDEDPRSLSIESQSSYLLLFLVIFKSKKRSHCCCFGAVVRSDALR